MTHHEPHESPWVVTRAAAAAGYPLGGDRLPDHRADAVRRLLQGRDRRRRGKHPAMAELAQRLPRPGRHGAARPDQHAAVLAGAGRRGRGLVHVPVNPALPAAIKARVQPLYTLLDNKYYMDWFNENVLARAARGRWARACGRAATRRHRRRAGQRQRARVGAVRRRGALAADRLHLPLRFAMIAGRVRADDAGTCGRASNDWPRAATGTNERTKMGLLSLAIWTPIFFGAVLLALGRDDQARPCAGSR